MATQVSVSTDHRVDRNAIPTDINWPFRTADTHVRLNFYPIIETRKYQRGYEGIFLVPSWNERIPLRSHRIEELCS